MSRNPLEFSLSSRMIKPNRWLNQDWLVLFLIISLVSFGLMMIYSASGSVEMVLRQGIFAVIGIVFMIYLSFSDYQRLLPIYLNVFWIGIFFLLVVLVIPSDAATRRWIDLGIFGFQPSELMRCVLTISAAAFLSRNPRIVLRDWIIVIGVSFFSFYLVFIQPDLGTAIMVLISGILPVLISGFPVSYQIIGIVTILLSTPFIWMNLLDYQKQRVLTFFDPDSDPLGAGWNIIQSQIAVGSGSLFGKGFLQGTQSQLNFVPESHTDFIFAVVAEEFGLFGVMGLFLVYLLLAFRLVMIAKNSNFLFVKLVAGTFIFLLLTYVAFNTSMVVGILPVVGMPLPFLSQGGTALIINMIMIGIILSFRRTA